MIEHRMADLGSVQLHYVETKNSGRPLLLLHGTLDSWESYQSLMPEFANLAYIYALDFRGTVSPVIVLGNTRSAIMFRIFTNSYNRSSTNRQSW